MTRPLDLSNKDFGRLTAVRRLKSDHAGKARWLCSCKCGGAARVRASDLVSGNVTSCGCSRSDGSTADRFRTHGESGTHLHQVWVAMKQRCLNPQNGSYKNYGGRGISICDRWRNSFEAFRDDMGPRPDGHTVERINNDGDYEPGNCKWATRAEQRLNTRQPCKRVA